MNLQFKRSIKRFIKSSGISNAYYSLQRSYYQHYAQILLNHFPQLYAQYRYKYTYGKKANLRNPATFDEKLLWLMLYWRHPLKTTCGDKYTLRSYVEKNGYSHVLPKLLGVYSHSSEIDFNLLPSKFVLKCSHGCSFNIFCSDKQTLDIKTTREKLDKWMAIDYSKNVGELHYADMKPMIICEEYLDELAGELPNDYKVYCFNGKAHCTMVAQGRDENGLTEKFDIYNLAWDAKPPYYYSDADDDIERHIPKPEAYDEMIRVAEALSKPFPYVRMDFYSINGRAILGEMTFTPSGCIQKHYTPVAQKILGSLIELPPKIK
jgi:hypothetical protein